MLNSSTSASYIPEIPSFFSKEELGSLDPRKVPGHVAIIMDGNRRWALKKWNKILMGHAKGADNVIDIVNASKELGIKTLTLYAFSTENWERNDKEVNTLFKLLISFLDKETQTMVENGVRLRTIGKTWELSDTIQTVIEGSKKATRYCTDIDLVLAINYGGRDEICRASQSLALDILEKKIDINAINEELFSKYLDTRLMPDPDLVIRTSGELRLSNFLLWQISYAELYVTRRYWPEFTPKCLLQALLYYQKRERRLGAL